MKLSQTSIEVESDGWQCWLHPASSRVGVVAIHEIFGHDDYIESVASSLAQVGIWAATVDLFRGEHPTSLEEGYKLRASLPKKDIVSAISAGAALLQKRIGAEAKVGSLGFCMGGGFALLGACNLPLAFCVDYYGMIDNPDEIQNTTGPIQLILGSEDQRVTPWAYEQFLPAAMKYKKRVDLFLYPNARHAFHRPDWEGHNPEAAKDAWSKTTTFLSQLK